MSILDRFASAARALILKPEPEPITIGPCEYCGDSGWAPCRCGGDLCTCDNHGEKPCPRGCPESGAGEGTS